MTAPDLCRLASAAFPGRTFHAIDFGGGTVSAASPALRVVCSRFEDMFSVSLRTDAESYRSAWHPTIEAAHADALACRAEYEPAPTVSAPAQLPLF
jgi:hypothetical protein